MDYSQNYRVRDVLGRLYIVRREESFKFNFE